MGDTITLERVYKKLDTLEDRMEAIEHLLIPTIKLGMKELKELEKSRESIRKGNYLAEKEIFEILGK